MKQTTLHNIAGQLVRTLLDRIEPAGEHSVADDGRNDRGLSVASGVYLYGINASEFVEAKQMSFVQERGTRRLCRRISDENRIE